MTLVDDLREVHDRCELFDELYTQPLITRSGVSIRYNKGVPLKSTTSY